MSIPAIDFQMSGARRHHEAVHMSAFGAMVPSTTRRHHDARHRKALHCIKSCCIIGTSAWLISLSGGKLKKIVDISICVPSTNVARAQECHALIGHIMCEAIEKNFC